MGSGQKYGRVLGKKPSVKNGVFIFHNLHYKEMNRVSNRA